MHNASHAELGCRLWTHVKQGLAPLALLLSQFQTRRVLRQPKPCDAPPRSASPAKASADSPGSCVRQADRAPSGQTSATPTGRKRRQESSGRRERQRETSVHVAEDRENCNRREPPRRSSPACQHFLSRRREPSRQLNRSCRCPRANRPASQSISAAFSPTNIVSSMKEHVLERKPLSISLMTCLLHHSSPTSLLTRPAYGKSGNSTHHGLKHRSTSPASPVPPIYVDVMRGMKHYSVETSSRPQSLPCRLFHRAPTPATTMEEASFSLSGRTKPHLGRLDCFLDCHLCQRTRTASKL